jgi:2-oxoglutarate ferredoxin oxidoreductase subunit beta
VFNDDVWAPVAEKSVRDDRTIWLEHGKPMRFGADGGKGIRAGTRSMAPEVVEVGDGPGQCPESELMIHDEQGSAAYHFMLSQMTYPDFPMPMGVFRAIERTPYDALATAQIERARADKGEGDLKDLLHSGMTWEVGPDGSPIG